MPRSKESTQQKLTQKDKTKLRKEMITRMDKMTSLIVRKRDSRCVSCGKKLPFDKRQNGHFVGRAFLPLRFDLTNCNVECASCNVFSPDHLVGYADYILRHYGQDKFDRLVNMRKQYKTGKIKNSIPIDEALRIYRALWDKTVEYSVGGKTPFPTSWTKCEKYRALKHI